VKETPDPGPVRRRHPRTVNLAGVGVNPLGGDLRPMLIQTHHDRHRVVLSLLASNSGAGSLQPTHRIPLGHGRPFVFE
jgi:hypothetical protein